MIFLFPRWDMLIPWRVWRKHHSLNSWRIPPEDSARWTKAKELNMEPGSLASSHFRVFFCLCGTPPCSFLDLLHRSRVHKSPRWITQAWYCFFHQHYGWWYCLILHGWIEILSMRKSVFSLLHTKSFRVRLRKWTWNQKIGGICRCVSFSKGAFVCICRFHVNFWGVYMSAIFRYLKNPPRIPVNARMTYILFLAKTPGNLLQNCNLEFLPDLRKPYLDGETTQIFFSFLPWSLGFHDLQFGTTKSAYFFKWLGESFTTESPNISARICPCRPWISSKTWPTSNCSASVCRLNDGP